MNLQAEKPEVLKMILDTNDKSIISEVKSIFKNHKKVIEKNGTLREFYDGFRDGAREVKSSLEGKNRTKRC